MSSNAAAVSKLQSIFGNVDKDVLQAVLDLCNGGKRVYFELCRLPKIVDTRAATTYLQANTDTPGGGYDAKQLQNNDGVPSDYPSVKKGAAVTATTTVLITFYFLCSF